MNDVAFYLEKIQLPYNGRMDPIDRLWTAGVRHQYLSIKKTSSQGDGALKLSNERNFIVDDCGIV